jgi:hypothetical protein
MGMRAEDAIESGQQMARIEGSWRAAAFPLTERELITNAPGIMGRENPYSLNMDLAEAAGLTYYINKACIANAFNDYRTLSTRPNCDLVTTWCTNAVEGQPYSGGPTLKAIIEASTNIPAGKMCHVDYGSMRLQNMLLFTGRDRDDDGEAEHNPFVDAEAEEAAGEADAEQLKVCTTPVTHTNTYANRSNTLNHICTRRPRRTRNTRPRRTKRHTKPTWLAKPGQKKTKKSEGEKYRRKQRKHPPGQLHGASPKAGSNRDRDWWRRLRAKQPRRGRGKRAKRRVSTRVTRSVRTAVAVISK